MTNDSLSFKLQIRSLYAPVKPGHLHALEHGHILYTQWLRRARVTNNPLLHARTRLALTSGSSLAHPFPQLLLFSFSPKEATLCNPERNISSPISRHVEHKPPSCVCHAVFGREARICHLYSLLSQPAATSPQSPNHPLHPFFPRTA